MVLYWPTGLQSLALQVSRGGGGRAGGMGCDTSLLSLVPTHQGAFWSHSLTRVLGSVGLAEPPPSGSEVGQSDSFGRSVAWDERQHGVSLTRGSG